VGWGLWILAAWQQKRRKTGHKSSHYYEGKQLSCHYTLSIASNKLPNPLEHLAKFGYRSNRKVENFRNPDILFWWQCVETYCLNLTISENKYTLGHFFQENPFYEWNWLFFFHQPEKLCPNKKRCWWLEDYPIRGLSRLGPPYPPAYPWGAYLPIYSWGIYLSIHSWTTYL